MYESFFYLQSRPFTAAPSSEMYVPAPVVEHARQTLIRIVDRAEGPGLVVGPAGVGKSLMLRILADHFQHVFHIVQLSSERIGSRKDLLQNVLFELDLPYRGMEEGELRLSLLDFLRPSDACPHGVLLLVDEAHTLSVRLLDEIRMITNLVRDGQPRVRLVLAGAPSLEEQFADPELESFNQRIAARCYLEPFTRDETREFIRAQLRAVGGDPDRIFSEDAVVAVQRAADGIPRLVNQLCDHALVMACLAGKHHIDGEAVEEAWADLQQLPGPWADSGDEVTPSAVIEFGSLDDSDEADSGHEALDENRSDERREHASGQPTDQPIDGPGPADPIAESSDPTLSDENDRESPVDGEDRNESHVVQFSSPEADFDFTEQIAAIQQTAPFQSNVFDVGWQSVQEQASELVARELAAAGQVDSPQHPSAPADSEPDDPFGGGFEQEEVVIDRYSLLEAEAMSGRPRVASPQGSELAGILQTTSDPIRCGSDSPEDHEPATGGVAAEDPEDQLVAFRPASEPGPDQGASRPESASPVLDAATLQVFECTVLEPAAEPAVELEAPPSSERRENGPDLTELQEENEADCGTLPPTDERELPTAQGDEADWMLEPAATSSAEAAESEGAQFLPLPTQPALLDDDRDLIVVDDEPDLPVEQLLTDAGPSDNVRQMDYQQLFAQLRKQQSPTG